MHKDLQHRLSMRLSSIVSRSQNISSGKTPEIIVGAPSNIRIDGPLNVKVGQDAIIRCSAEGEVIFMTYNIKISLRQSGSKD